MVGGYRLWDRVTAIKTIPNGKRMLTETEAGRGDPELDFQGILTVLQTSWNELKGYGKENIFFHKHLWMTEGNGLIESTILL